MDISAKNEASRIRRIFVQLRFCSSSGREMVSSYLRLDVYKIVFYFDFSRDARNYSR